jgi:TfoX/Sxy family transcriptional regulator of competence genes
MDKVLMDLHSNLNREGIQALMELFLQLEKQTVLDLTEATSELALAQQQGKLILINYLKTLEERIEEAYNNG